ncbi:Retrovirus-related Pol polyprotein from type-1 retrotransposable element R1, partial [Araneus ventricosus]
MASYPDANSQSMTSLLQCVSNNSSPILKILQINLHKCEPAMSQLRKTAPNHQIDIILAQEPYFNNNEIKGIPERWRTWSSNNGKAAIIAPTSIKVVSLTPLDNCVAVKIQLQSKPCTLISAYSSPLEDIEPTLLEMQDLLDSIPGESYIIGADLNGHHTSWGYNDTSPRGRAIEDMISHKHMILLNPVDAPPTFFHTNGTVGRPDLTLTSNNDLAQKIEWQVLKEETFSDHAYIKINVNLERNSLSFHRFKTKFGGHKKFISKIKALAAPYIEQLKHSTTKSELDKLTNDLHKSIIEACKSSYRLKRQEINKPPAWWTQELDITKKKVGALRRAQRAPTEVKRGACIIYARERAKYRRILLKTRRRAWKKFCTEASNPFGRHYKAIFRKGRPPSDLFQQIAAGGNELNFAETILKTLFPETEQHLAHPSPLPAAPADRPFSHKEIKTILKGLNKTKAPGFDGVDNIILQQIHKASPDLLLVLYNKCLELGLFPTDFKIGVIVLFYKEGKRQDDPKSYRPISLLPALGKLLEKLLTQRLNFFLKNSNQQNPKQFGFKEGTSIDNALTSLVDQIHEFKRQKLHVAVVSVDIKGAFDNLHYGSIISKLNECRCPPNIKGVFESLLQDRKIVIPTNNGIAQQTQSRGCPQGSCSGPAIWNLVADDALKGPFPDNTSVQAFADDFVTVAAAKSERALGRKATEALSKFKEWSDKNGLEISVEKTNYLLVGKLRRGPSIFWGDRRVKKTQVLKYLGVYVDKKMNWSHHLMQQGAKALQQSRGLLRLAGSTWGLSPKHRAQIYKSVTERMIAHGATAWGRSITYNIKTKLDQIQRPFLINISGAYRTSPTAALQAITGILPLHLKIEAEANFVALTRTNKKIWIEDEELDPAQFEKKEVGWSHHPATELEEDRISTSSEFSKAEGINIYTDGSKSEQGVGTAFCEYDHSNSLSHTWQAKLHPRNSVYQAELVGILKASTHAASTNRPTKIWSDSLSSLQALQDLKTSSPIARQIQRVLLKSPNISLGWIKAHVGHEGNEKADELAKEVITLPDSLSVDTPFPRSWAKRKLLERAKVLWQQQWDKEKYGRSTHKVIPKVSLKTYNWPRQVTHFVTEHGPFPYYLHRFGKHRDPFCACGEEGTPLHYAVHCPLTASYHFRDPGDQHLDAWRKSLNIPPKPVQRPSAAHPLQEACGKTPATLALKSSGHQQAHPTQDCSGAKKQRQPRNQRSNYSDKSDGGGSNRNPSPDGRRAHQGCCKLLFPVPPTKTVKTALRAVRRRGDGWCCRSAPKTLAGVDKAFSEGTPQHKEVFQMPKLRRMQEKEFLLCILRIRTSYELVQQQSPMLRQLLGRERQKKSWLQGG